MYMKENRLDHKLIAGGAPYPEENILKEISNKNVDTITIVIACTATSAYEKVHKLNNST